MKNHTCEAALITCEDFRLHQRSDGRNYIAEFIKSLGVNCDLITRAGGVQDIVRPKDKAYCECELRDLGVSTKLHCAKTLYLVNHTDCGAYKNLNLSTELEEYNQHKEDLAAAKKIILREYPDLDIKLYLAKLITDKEDEFKMIEIN